MLRKTLLLTLSLLVISSLFLVACAADEATEEPAPAPEEVVEEPPEEPEPEPEEPAEEPMVEAGPQGITADALQGIEVEFWHVWDGVVGEAMAAIIEDFNATNPYGITVAGYDQGGYSEIFNNMNAAINTGDLPDLAIGYNNQYLAWDAAGDVIVDMTPYVENEYFGFSAEDVADFYPAFWASDAIGGERLGIPAQRSGSYFFYNYTWAQELGFNSPPTTPAEFKEQSCAAAAANGDGTGGMFFKSEASTIVAWVWAFGGEVEVPGEGYNFNTPEAIEAVTFLLSLLEDGCAWTPESRYPNTEFSTRLGLFYGSSIAGLPYQEADMESVGSTDVWGPIAFPTVTGEPVVDLYGPSVAMVTSTPEEQLAAWMFIKWFTEPENQTSWIEASAYYPTRASVLDLLSDYMESNTRWSDSLSYLEYGKVEPRFESWSTCRYTVGDGVAEIAQEGFTADMIPDLMARIDTECAELHAETLE
jgi:ABC-type glycerol-3-phosphate transport system substrate-binding protein